MSKNLLLSVLFFGVLGTVHGLLTWKIATGKGYHLCPIYGRWRAPWTAPFSPG